MHGVFTFLIVINIIKIGIFGVKYRFDFYITDKKLLFRDFQYNSLTSLDRHLSNLKFLKGDKSLSVNNINAPFETLGHIAWLWANSPLHRNWSLSLLAINTLPAIHHNQYVLLMRNNFPVAFCSWANLSLENEVKYLDDVASLSAEDWNSGDRKWFIDWIAPFGDNGALYKHMRKLFAHDVFRAIRVEPNGKTGKIVEFHGGKIDKKLASKIFQQYHFELMSELKTKPDFKFSILKEGE